MRSSAPPASESARCRFQNPGLAGHRVGRARRLPAGFGIPGKGLPQRTKPRANSTSQLAFLLALSLVPTAFALDDRTVTSPDGRIAFRVFVAPQEPGGLSRLAYQVLVQGKPVVETSYLGLDIENQE